MNNRHAGDASDAAALAGQSCVETTKPCPQFRPCDLTRMYPVRGYCILTQTPGWLMIPSIEEYRMYCTGWGFAQCPWFRQGGESATRVEPRAVRQAARMETWQPPEIDGPSLFDQD